MANLESAKKQARKNIIKRERNLGRRTSVKTAVKKVLASIERNDSLESIQALFREAESKLARAKGKNVIHGNNAQRKIGRLAKRIAALQKEQPLPSKK